MQERHTQDPYTPPPMHHDRSGPVLRIAIIAALIGAGAWGYMSMAGQSEQTALAPAAVEEIQVADAGYPTPTEALPPAEPAATQQAPAPAAAPARAPRRSAPVETPPLEPTPAPELAPAPTAPTPIPPMDLPPSG